MNLFVGIEDKDKNDGSWRNILEASYLDSEEMEPGILNVPDTSITLENGEEITVSSIYAIDSSGIALWVKQNGKTLIELSCSGFLDVVCRTSKGYGVRLFTHA